MPFKSTLSKVSVLVFFAICCWSSTSRAQQKYTSLQFKIDSLTDIGLPKSALNLVDKLETMARADNNAPQQIKAVIYRMTFQSYLQEDALVAIINRLKLDIVKAEYPVKPVLQSLLAQIYWNYYQQNRYRTTQRSKLQVLDTDFTKWDLPSIISQTAKLYALSLQNAAQAQQTPVGILNGVLQGDSSTRYLRPTFYDLLLQRALTFFLSPEADMTKPKLPFSLNNPAFYGDSRSFTQLDIKTTDTASNFYKGLKYLQQATSFHLTQNNKEALANLDLQRLEFLHQQAYEFDTDSLYLVGLQKVAMQFSDKPISADALVLIGQFYQGQDSLVKARQVLMQAKIAFPNSKGGSNAAILLSQIEQKELSATVEDVNVPNKPILGLIKYKNVSSAIIKIYKLSSTQLENFENLIPLPKVNNNISTGYIDSLEIRNHKLEILQLKYLKKLTPVQTNHLNWNEPDDYVNHSFEFKINELPFGNYVLLLNDSTNATIVNVDFMKFKVSNLSFNARINPDDNIEVRVMNRESGLPLENVKIDIKGSIYRYNTNKGINVEKELKGITDKNGKFFSDSLTGVGNYKIKMVLGKDTLSKENNFVNGYIDNKVEDEDPIDKTILFTDRQIYRPGQTVYFKGIQLQTFKGKSKIIVDTLMDVVLTDANNKEVSTLKLKTNQFGSFAGIIVLPKTTLNGEFTLSTKDGEINLQVEEYKRPTFKIEFLPIIETYKLNDSVTIKGKVNTFSGYGLSGARVAYRITRTQLYEYGHGRRFDYRLYNRSVEIKTDTVKTNANGEFLVKFKAIPGISNLGKYNFQINADITDESGETHAGETSVAISNHNILIVNYLPENIFVNDAIKTSIGIQNLNNQPQKGTITVDVYSLKNPARLFKTRLWPEPDQFLISAEDYKNDFPDYAYKGEDKFSNWQIINKVLGINQTIEADKPNILNLEALKMQPSGLYKITINAKDELGDTVSEEKFVNLINMPSIPVKTVNWVIPQTNEVSAGKNAEFLVGNGQEINVMMEIYHSSKIISSKWMSIGKVQQLIKIPIADTDKEVAVQFMMVYHNRFYSSYQKIYITKPKSNLDIKFLTFHNKLQPGQKEEWKLQIGNKSQEKSTTEMLATLYDASLDEITEPANWNDVLVDKKGFNINYFQWEMYGFILNTWVNIPYYKNDGVIFSYPDYEQLDLFGCNYYGGYNPLYNNYKERIKRKLNDAELNRSLQEEYRMKATLIKDGYDIVGKIIDKDNKERIPGVSVKIKGMKLGTMTNANGYFKLKVPIGATLVISFFGYESTEIITNKAEELNIGLKPSSRSLGEVVVAYGVQAKRDVTGAVQKVAIRGIADTNLIFKSVDVDVLKNANLSGIYGSVTGPIMKELEVADPGFKNKKEQPIIPRTNFAETAFFYPQLQTNEKGEVLLNFTMPEALTRWKFRGFAHTKDLQTGYIENTIVTQKQLSITANTPRFLREGDTITISARLANLADSGLKGTVQIKLFNASNMRPVSLLINGADSLQSFNIASNTNQAVSFRIAVPAGLEALTYRLTADGGQFTDGEENTLPVLPNSTLVTESMPMLIRAGQTRSFAFNRLLNQSSNTLKNKTLTLEYTQNPAWYAVQALPYMMEFPYECSEQVFSRYFANRLATNIVSKMPAIKRVFDLWKTANSTKLLSNLEKNTELKSTLIEETPWLNDAISESEQKKRIALLFDLNKMGDELKLNLEKLQKRQLANGGFAWFGGEDADRFITQHITEGIGELYHVGIANNDSTLKKMATNAIKYLDNQLLADEAHRVKNKQAKYFGDLEIHTWYTRSFFMNIPLSSAMQKLRVDYLKWATANWTNRNVYEQGLIALTMLRYNKPLVTVQIEKSLLETAQHSVELGMYWAKNLQGYSWYQSPIETQSLLIALFTETGGNAKAVDEMKIWLLRNKQTNNWKTTKATAEACYALLLKGSDLLVDAGKSTIKVDAKPLEQLKPDVKLDAGTGYFKTTWVDEQIKPSYGKVEITNKGKTPSWGALHWQYLEKLDKITSAETNIRLERKYYIQQQTDNGLVLTAVDAQHPAKIGDLLKVVINLKADRDFEYVQLKDMRPSGTEPVEALSSYKYQDGLYYYQVSKDVATNFFISNLNKGSYVFEYQLRVVQPGNFSTGITTIQCMYAPEYNAHSNGERMIIKP